MVNESAAQRLHRISITHFRNVVSSGRYQLSEPYADLMNPNIMGKTFTIVNPRSPQGFQNTSVKVCSDRGYNGGDFMFTCSTLDTTN
jgi:hypothetical protein